MVRGGLASSGNSEEIPFYIEEEDMYQITGYTIDRSIRREFECLFDAIEFKDQLDALYYHVVWKEYRRPYDMAIQPVSENLRFVL